jgi:tetratricopeptide (TPR) repeat protein
MRETVRRWAVLALVLSAGVVRAEGTGDETLTRAHEIFVQADGDYRLGRYEQAAAGYEQAYQLAHAPEILYNVAQANRRWYESANAVEPLRRAYDAYRAFIRDAPGAPQRANAEREVERLRVKLVATEHGRPAVLLAEKLLSEGDAASAGRLLERRLAEPDLSRADLTTALEASGRASARAGDRSTALERFERALTIDPLVALGSDGGPLANEAWSAAQAKVRAHGPLALERENVEPGAHVAVRVRDPLRLTSKLALHARRSGGSYAVAEQPAEGHVATLDLPGSVAAGATIGTRFDWYVVALDRGRVALATLGSADAPLELVTAAPRPRWYKRGWVWATIAVSALAAGAAVGVGVYFGTRATPPVFPVPTQ